MGTHEARIVHEIEQVMRACSATLIKGSKCKRVIALHGSPGLHACAGLAAVAERFDNLRLKADLVPRQYILITVRVLREPR